jgi:hypothetical protein
VDQVEKTVEMWLTVRAAVVLEMVAPSAAPGSPGQPDRGLR